MADEKKQQEQRGEVSFNMTPMIDCVFLLIIFFLLASSFASERLPQLQPHRPEDSQALPREDTETPNKIIINILSAEDEVLSEDPSVSGVASHYNIDGSRIDAGDTSTLADVIRERKERAREGDFFVEVRADWRVSYEEVAPVMRAAARAEIENVNLTALTAVAGEY